MANTREVMGEQACLDALVADTLVTYEDDGVINVGFLKNHNTLQQVILPSATHILPEGLYKCPSLQSFSAPNATMVENNAFEDDKRLESVTINSITSNTAGYAFSRCHSLSTFNVESLSKISGYMFQQCHSLAVDTIDLSDVDYVGTYAFNYSGVGELVLPKATSLISYTAQGGRLSVIDMGKSNNLSSNLFVNSYALCHLILRGVTGVVSCTDTALLETGIGSGIGWIYVPADLVNSYKDSSIWSSYASQIVSISEYPKALQDETVSDSWATIAASSTYATDYPIGSIKYVNIGGTRLAMQLVATDTDDLSSGGKARMTWISRDAFTFMEFCLESNEPNVNWDTSWLRNFLRTTIYPQIEQDVRTEIKEVSKTFLARGNVVDTANDNIWIPSAREMGMSTSAESSGCTYASFFTDATSRIKKRGIAGSSSSWWLRSASGNYNFQIVGTGGNASSASPTSKSWLVIGFCI